MALAPATSLVIGPEHDGQPMKLEEFAHADAISGYRYELERGVIVVDVPRLTHELVVQNTREALTFYKRANPGRVFLVSGGMGSVLRLPGVQSERHPDITVYLHGPESADDNPWDYWVPALVFEVVSKSSVKRDYVTKREEYLLGGVREYVIIDSRDHTALALTRRGDVWDERRLTDADAYVTSLLPGFSLSLADVFSIPMQ